MIDIVTSDGLGEMAEKLGYSRLCCLDCKPRKQDIAAYSRKKKISIMSGEPRKLFENIKPDIVRNLEDIPRADFLHQRNSGLNHVLARLAHENKVAVAFTPSSDARTMGRMMQNIKLCRKYKVEMVIASFAKSPYQLKSPSELVSYFTVLGMHPKEAKRALNYVEMIENV